MKALFAPIVGSANVLENEPLAAHTTFRIGGPCQAMVFPKSPEELAEVMALCKLKELPTFVLGKGSNVLVADTGIDGVVIATDHIRQLTVDGERVTASAGLSLIDVSKACAELGLSGLEFASGIPGSIGGAAYMNAGAYDGEMKDVVMSVTVLDEAGDVVEIPASEMKFSYRHSLLKEQPLVCLAVTMQLARADKREILAKIADLTERRTSRQPLELPSAGSTFKRPVGHYAGPLIIDAGLQGYTVGGAQVSTKHAGFVVNVGEATADDVIRLIHHVQHEVRRQFGVDLETEVRFIGKWQAHPLFDEILRAE
ncbi:MAG: UDP-N-acetylmuramate dehydrogenase [Peptococcaceae bacterium]|nr:UDP-N-acetylmuramate dehydrogenase [Peptococcaceae bacterium]